MSYDLYSDCKEFQKVDKSESNGLKGPGSVHGSTEHISEMFLIEYFMLHLDLDSTQYILNSICFKSEAS